jgi:hypothetical protein
MFSPALLQRASNCQSSTPELGGKGVEGHAPHAASGLILWARTAAPGATTTGTSATSARPGSTARAACASACSGTATAGCITAIGSTPASRRATRAAGSCAVSAAVHCTATTTSSAPTGTSCTSTSTCIGPVVRASNTRNQHYECASQKPFHTLSLAMKVRWETRAIPCKPQAITTGNRI